MKDLLEILACRPDNQGPVQRFALKQIKDTFEMSRLNDSGLIVAQRIETPPPFAPRPTDITRFSDQAKEGLQDLGYQTYELTGQPIANISLWTDLSVSVAHRYKVLINNLCSRYSEVAVNPESLLLKETANKDFTQQQLRLSIFTKNFYEQYLGEDVELTIGHAADYFDLLVLNAKVRDAFLREANVGEHSIRTLTQSTSGKRSRSRMLVTTNSKWINVDSNFESYKWSMLMPLVFPK